MKNIDENIKSYMEYVLQAPKKNEILSFLAAMFMVGVPTAINGSCSSLTKITILPAIAIFSIWIMYLLIDTASKQQQYNLFLGCYCLFISICCILAGYKIAVSVGKVSVVDVFIALICYVFINIYNFYNTLRLIKKGYYKQKSKSGIKNIPIIAIYGLSLCIIKLMGPKLSQHSVENILVILMLSMGFLLSMGTLNFLKYYYSKHYDI